MDGVDHVFVGDGEKDDAKVLEIRPVRLLVPQRYRHLFCWGLNQLGGLTKFS